MYTPIMHMQVKESYANLGENFSCTPLEWKSELLSHGVITTTKSILSALPSALETSFRCDWIYCNIVKGTTESSVFNLIVEDCSSNCNFDHVYYKNHLECYWYSNLVRNYVHACSVACVCVHILSCNIHYAFFSILSIIVQSLSPHYSIPIIMYELSLQAWFIIMYNYMYTSLMVMIKARCFEKYP